MAGRGVVPKEAALRKNPRQPIVHDWQALEVVGWQHGDVPEPPAGLMPASVEAWRVWLGAWFAAYWTPEDLPGLRQLIRLYDQVERGEFQRANEVRIEMDNYGITPKGQQDRRWRRPVEEPKAMPARSPQRKRLKVV